MAIGPNELKTAIIMCKRASCSGEESLAVAQTIITLEAEYKAAVQPPEKKDGDKEPKAPETPPKQKRKPRGK